MPCISSIELLASRKCHRFARLPRLINHSASFALAQCSRRLFHVRVVQLAVVVVGFPATPLLLSRARFCVSAGHTRADLDHALEKIREVTRVLRLRYKTHFFG